MTAQLIFSKFYLSPGASAIASVTASISFISSSLIVSIISRSQSKLTTTYHRVMFFMSASNLMTSLAIALTTLPMPRDVVYDFGTASYGNTFTCSLQGFAAYVGSVLGIFSICILCMYYVCVIKFQLDSEKIKKYVEPTLYCLSMILALFPGISIWKTGLINPQPYEPYCFVGSYPFGCAGDCIRGGDSEGPRKKILTFALRYYLFLVIVLGLLIVVISMAIILVSIRRKERAVSTTTRLMNDNKTSNVGTVQQRPQAPQPSGISRNCDGSFCPSGEGKDLDTEMTYSTPPVLERAQSIRRKKITFQACMYILAFLLTWVFPVLTFCIRRNIVIAVFKMIFQPSQGFFNAIIFVYHKVDNFQEAYPGYSFFEATWKVLRHPEEVPDTVVKGCELLHIKSLFGSSPDDVSLVADEEESPAGFSRNMVIPEEVDAGAQEALNDNAFAFFNERLEKKNDENSTDSLVSSLRQHRSVDGNSTGRSSQDVIGYRYYS